MLLEATAGGVLARTTERDGAVLTGTTGWFLTTVICGTAKAHCASAATVTAGADPRTARAWAVNACTSTAGTEPGASATPGSAPAGEPSIDTRKPDETATTAPRRLAEPMLPAAAAARMCRLSLIHIS